MRGLAIATDHVVELPFEEHLELGPCTEGFTDTKALGAFFQFGPHVVSLEPRCLELVGSKQRWAKTLSFLLSEWI